MMEYDLKLKRSEVEARELWKEWCNKIPYLRFDPDWEVQIIPPFAGALARFIVRKGDKYVSVYFDAYSQLGFMYDEADEPIPYYEIYPAPDGDVRRYHLDKTEEMINDIREVING